MATLTPPAPVGAPLIVPPPEGDQKPTPAAGLASWLKAASQFVPQSGLL